MTQEPLTLRITVLSILENGDHIVRAEEYGKDILIHPLEAKVLINWVRPSEEWIEITHEVALREGLLTSEGDENE